MRYSTILKGGDVRRNGTPNHISKSFEVVGLLIEKLYDKVAEILKHDAGQQYNIKFELFGQLTILVM